MTQPLEPGSQLGPYRIIGRLGAGGAGAVFEAQHEHSGKRVALKTMLATSVGDEEIHSRFVREISIAQKLNDSNIVAYDECGVEGDVLYYTMELVPWGPMNDVLTRRRRLNWQEAAECGIQICRGLRHLHDAGIVHRDLKPANIFLSDDGQLKLGDFGLARDLGSFRLTMDGKTVGTAKYLAPEQARAEDDLDGRTDLYSLGCILFEMIAGRPPFVDADAFSQASYFEMMKRHVEETPPKLSEFATVPESMEQLVATLLMKRRENRCQSAEEVGSRLKAILDGDESAEVIEDEEPAASLTERLHESADENVDVNWRVLIVVAAAVTIGVMIAMLSGQ